MLGGLHGLKKTNIALGVLVTALGAALGLAVGSLTTRTRTTTIVSNRTTVSVTTLTLHTPAKTITVSKALTTTAAVATGGAAGGNDTRGTYTTSANSSKLPDCQVSPPPCYSAPYP
jgi:hypothetical protein